MIQKPKQYSTSSIPMWFVEVKANEAEQKSEMEFRENGGYLDGNNYFYRYEALQGLIDDWYDWLGEHNE